MPDDSEEINASGWDAIDEALRPLYGDTEPLHWGVIVPYGLGGDDPIRGTSAYCSDEPRHHLHYVTYGFSELYEKESDDPETSGYGFELTFRLACEPGDEPPNWALNFLQNLGRYVFETGNGFGDGHTMPLNGPISVGSDTRIHAIAFARDPQLDPIDTPNGRVEFLQIVGLTVEELDAVECWNAARFLELVREQNPLLITDLARASYLDDPKFRGEVERLTAEEGASAEALYGYENTRVILAGKSFRFAVGALVARSLAKRLPGRIPFGRPFSVWLKEGNVRFEPGDSLSWDTSGDTVTLTLTAEQCGTLSRLLASPAGRYEHPALPRVEIIIERTEIKDNDGNVVDVVE